MPASATSMIPVMCSSVALDLPRGSDREIITDGDHRYVLNGDDSRTLATVEAFRVVRERESPKDP
jgi:hypothetical protein